MGAAWLADLTVCPKCIFFCESCEIAKMEILCNSAVRVWTWTCDMMHSALCSAVHKQYNGIVLLLFSSETNPNTSASLCARKYVVQ